MRSPSFWNIKTGRDSAIFLRTLLMPFSYIYDYFTQKRIYEANPKYLGIPVISIGNITLGGTGKTPIAIEIANIFEKIWGKPAIVSRGYGGSLINATKVTPNLSAKDVGDEPLMLSRYHDVFISKNRIEAAELALNNGAKAIILDDAHQNPFLKKHISFVVIDGAIGFGNGQICPAGPLRESPENGLKRADAIIWVGDKTLLNEELENNQKPIFFANIIAKKKYDLEDSFLAFCGIGRPQKFHDTLKENNVKIIDLIPFPDHHFYSEKELKMIDERAKIENCKIITTEKDFVRLPKWFQEKCETFEIIIDFEDKNKLEDFIQQKLKSAIE